MMKILKIVVDRVSSNCYECDLSDSGSWSGKRKCQILCQDVTNPYKRLPDCPLVVVDGVCEWKSIGDGFYQNPHYKEQLGCLNNMWTHCPNCGKRIKYVEVE